MSRHLLDVPRVIVWVNKVRSGCPPWQRRCQLLSAVPGQPCGLPASAAAAVKTYRGRMLGQRKASGRRISLCQVTSGLQIQVPGSPGWGPSLAPLGQCQADGGRTGEQACVASCGQADGPTVGKQQVTQLLLSRVGRDEGGACSSLALGFPLEAGGRLSGPASGAPPFEFPRQYLIAVSLANCI